MGKTSINIVEETVNSATSGEGGGEIATVLNAVRGSVSKVFTLTRTADLTKIFGISSNLDYQYCSWLLGRGNVLRVVRAPLKSTFVEASVLFPYAGTGDSGLKVTALGAGEGGNDLKVIVTNQGGTGKDNLFSLVVYQKNLSNAYDAIEMFNVVSLNPDSEYFFGKVVKSDCVKLAFQNAEGVVYTDQTLFASGTNTYDKPLTGGTGKARTEDLDTDAYKTALTLLENREIGFATLILPTLAPSDVTAAAKDLVNKRKDFVLLVDPVEGTTVANALTGLKLAMTATEDSSYVAGYYPRGVMAQFGSTVAPSIAVADLIARLHERKLWFKSPAGLEYGLIPSFIDLEKELTKKEIEDLQEAGLNPLVIKTGSGVAIWNDATEGSSPIDVQSLPTRLLVNYFKRTIYSISQRFLFADHTEYTWSQWKNSVEPIIRNVANIGGLNAYEVICDRTIMSDEDIANGILRGLVRIWPISHIKQIEIKFAIDETGVTFE